VAATGIKGGLSSDDSILSTLMESSWEHSTLASQGGAEQSPPFVRPVCFSRFVLPSGPPRFAAKVIRERFRRRQAAGLADYQQAPILPTPAPIRS
jgi:hypothetical protein